jgi:hypothetical protein
VNKPALVTFRDRLGGRERGPALASQESYSVRPSTLR